MTYRLNNKCVYMGKHSIYGVWYSLRLQASTEGLGTYIFFYFFILYIFDAL